MSSASQRLLIYLIERRWPVHVLVICGYAGALVATAHEWYSAMWMYYAAALVGLFRMDESAVLVGRGVRLLPISNRERERLLWAWVFLAPVAVLAVSLVATWLISGMVLGFSIERSALIALYLVAPYSLRLLTSRLPATRARASIQMIGALLWVIAAVTDLAQPAPSPVFLSMASVLLVVGLSFPWWMGVKLRSMRETPSARENRAVQPRWPTGVAAMICSRVRASIPSILVMAGFILIMAIFSSRHRHALGPTISIMSLFVMGYIWMSNWRWLCHFRALRCLPLSSWQLTALTLGISIVPSATVWIIQYAVTAWILAETPVSFVALLALAAVQLVTVPVFLYAPGWLRLNWLAALLPTVFLAAQSLVALVGVEQFQPWIQSRPRIWLVLFVCALVACAFAAVVWTYREITQGRHAYRAQSHDWAPPTWAWPE